MNIRQEENTPIGDYFHDAGLSKMFSKLEEQVDEFEVDTDELKALCDGITDTVKGLKAHIAKVEAAWQKRQNIIQTSDKYSNRVI